MIRVLALHNTPVELSSYDDYYVNVHMPLVRRIPGVRNIRYGRVIRAADGGPAPYFLISDVYFDDEATSTTRPPCRPHSTRPRWPMHSPMSRTSQREAPRS